MQNLSTSFLVVVVVLAASQVAVSQDQAVMLGNGEPLIFDCPFNGSCAGCSEWVVLAYTGSTGKYWGFRGFDSKAKAQAHLERTRKFENFYARFANTKPYSFYGPYCRMQPTVPRKALTTAQRTAMELAELAVRDQAAVVQKARQDSLLDYLEELKTPAPIGLIRYVNAVRHMQEKHQRLLNALDRIHQDHFWDFDEALQFYVEDFKDSLTQLEAAQGNLPAELRTKWGPVRDGDLDPSRFFIVKEKCARCGQYYPLKEVDEHSLCVRCRKRGTASEGK